MSINWNALQCTARGGSTSELSTLRPVGFTPPDSLHHVHGSGGPRPQPHPLHIVVPKINKDNMHYNQMSPSYTCATFPPATCLGQRRSLMACRVSLGPQVASNQFPWACWNFAELPPKWLENGHMWLLEHAGSGKKVFPMKNFLLDQNSNQPANPEGELRADSWELKAESLVSVCLSTPS